MKKFIVRRDDPYENDRSENHPDEFTLGAKKVFNGIVMDMIEDEYGITHLQTPKRTSYTILNYDIVEDIDSRCYIQSREIKPGQMIDSWREPTDEEYKRFLNLLHDEYKLANREKDFNDDIIYKDYISKSRDNKIKELGI